MIDPLGLPSPFTQGSATKARKTSASVAMGTMIRLTGLCTLAQFFQR